MGQQRRQAMKYLKALQMLAICLIAISTTSICRAEEPLEPFLVETTKGMSQQDLNFALCTRSTYLQDISYLKDIVAKGGDVNFVDLLGNSPLHYAATVRHADQYVMFLVSKGANIHAKGFNGRTVMHFVVGHCELETIKYFVSKGVDLSAKDDDGINVWACGQDEKIRRYLRAHGAK